MILNRKRPERAPGPSPWYSVPDLMRLFDISERCVWNWGAAGKLPAPVRQGRRWTRWPKATIDALLARWAGEVA